MKNQYLQYDNAKYISIKDTSEILGISYGSVYNWIRHGYLKPVKGRKLFNKNEVISVKKNIEEGKLNRLNRYANKSKSHRFFVPVELLKSREHRININQITEYVFNNKLDIGSSLFYLCINMLFRKKIITSISVEQLIKSNFKIPGKTNLQKELHSWFNKSVTPSLKYYKLLEFKLPDNSDIAGIIYQSLKMEGNKNIHGSYYTPDSVINMISSEYSFSDCIFFDPCCGTGRFLINFADKIKNPSDLTGFDIDETAVRIARINLIIKYRNIDFMPNIFCINTLLHSSLPDFFKEKRISVIATNPPWGLHFNDKELEILNNKYPEISSGESFSYFLKVCIELLEKNSSLVFILPESILNIKNHKDIRKYILQNSSIIKIKYLNKLFKNVFTKVILLELSGNKKTEIKSNNSPYIINSDRFKKNTDLVFDININNTDYDILNRLYKKPYYTLKNNAEWALGIVTGNNKKYLKQDKNFGEPIFRGRDIKPYFLSKPEYYIKYNPNIFQQAAPDYKYRSDEKLIYKFISNKLIFAYDNNKSLTLNSANIVIPKIQGYSLKVVMALFNSSLYQYIFHKKFSSIKVLKSHLESLPIPVLKENDLENILLPVNKILDKNNISFNIDLIDNLIFDIFMITSSEKAYIKNIIK